MANEILTEGTEKQKSGLAKLIDQIKIMHHDNKAYYYRYACNDYDLESYMPGISPGEKTRFQQEAERCAIKARYHEQKARAIKAKYDLPAQAYEK
jgi:hypothetical protein